MKDHKWDLIFFSFYDRTGMERHLEQRAAQGWLLERITNLGWHYRRIEPKQLHFTVTYYLRSSQFDPEPTEEQQEFHDFCLQSGWKLAAASGKMQVFYNEEEDPVPIDTEPSLELERIGEIAMRYLLAWIILGGVGLVMNAAWLWSMLRRPIDLLSSAYNLTTGAIWLMLFLWCAADLTGVEDDRYITRSHSDATFLITQREFYQHMFYDQLQPGERFATLDYTIVDVHLPFLYNWCVEQLLHHRDDIRADYAASLLQFTAGRRGSIRAPLAFGEGAARERIENIMKYKRPTGLAVVPAALLCLVLTACPASGV